MGAERLDLDTCGSWPRSGLDVQMWEPLVFRGVFDVMVLNKITRGVNERRGQKERNRGQG